MIKLLKSAISIGNWSAVFRWLLVLILFILAAYYIDWPSVLTVFKFRHVLSIIVVQPIQFLVILILAWRFAFLAQGNTKNTHMFFKTYILSIGLNSFLPGKLSEFVKISYLQSNANIPASSSMAALFLERITDALFLGGIVLLGMGSIWINVNETLLTIVLLTMVMFIFLLPRIEVVLLSWMRNLPGKKFHQLFQDTISEAASKVQKREFPLTIALGALAWIGSFTLVYVVLKILHGFEINFENSLVIFSAMALGRAIPGLPGGIGTFEAAIVFAMSHFGFDFSEAFATALTLRASQLILVTATSLIILGSDGTGIRSLLASVRSGNAQS